jgi:hypothetical protein
LIASLPVQGDDVCLGGEALQDTAAFGGEYFSAKPAIDVFLGDLEDV